MLPKEQRIKTVLEGNKYAAYVQCDKCGKWQEFPPHVSSDGITASDWSCSMMTWYDSDSVCNVIANKVSFAEEVVEKASVNIDWNKICFPQKSLENASVNNDSNAFSFAKESF